jgi:hypothetical protein
MYSENIRFGLSKKQFHKKNLKKTFRYSDTVSKIMKYLCVSNQTSVATQ